MRRVCLIPKLSGIGGMVSFRQRIAAALAARGVEVVDNLGEGDIQAVLVIGGTRQLAGLWQARQHGVRIVQRLDGMNWIHRLRRTGLRHYLRAEYGNWLLALIRARLAHHVVYQSRFARDWWEGTHGPTPVAHSVVYNGVDLSLYTPHGPQARPMDRYRLLLVEGSLMGGYEWGLETAIHLAQELHRRLTTAVGWKGKREVELMVVGRVSPQIQARWQGQTPVPLIWASMVPPQQIPEIDRSAHILYSADLNPACPNAVIEALACGLPVLAFNTGALPELVPAEAGRVVPYGGNPWRLEEPDIPALTEAALEILQSQEAFRRAARQHAEAAFDLDKMVDGYLQALLGE